MTQLDSLLKHAWTATQLPGVREHSQRFATYSSFSIENLPAVPGSLEDDFAWLQKEPVQDEWAISLVEDPKDKLSVSQKIAGALSDTPYPLPESFRYFITHPELHLRIRSCTGCYLELPNFPVRTGGVEKGCVVHFLSDQQWCLHWYLYLNEQGEQRILCSLFDYGIYPLPEGDERDADTAHVLADGSLDIQTMSIWLTGKSFPEFIYRFWIENELWYILTEGGTPTPEQQAYLDDYNRR